METTLQTCTSIRTSTPWHTTVNGIQLLRFPRKQYETTPTMVVMRLLKNSVLWYCGDFAIDDAIQRKISTRDGYIVAATAPGQRRILRVRPDGCVEEIPEDSFDFLSTRDWTVLVRLQT